MKDLVAPALLPVKLGRESAIGWTAAALGCVMLRELTTRQRLVWHQPLSAVF